MTAATAAPPVTTRAMLTALTAHYRKPGTARDGEVLITEPEAPGSLRRCDLVRIGMWRSRGTGIDAHEIKVSRSDWLRELDDPAKAEAWWPFCSRFWLAAPPGVVADGELPDGWGLMEPQARSRRFKIRVQAATKDPQLTVPLMIELLRRADNQRLSEIDQIRSRHGQELYEAEQRARSQAVMATLPPGLQKRIDLLERLETAIGAQLDTFAWGGVTEFRNLTPEELAAALKDLREHVGAQRVVARSERCRKDLRSAAASVLKRLEEAP